MTEETAERAVRGALRLSVAAGAAALALPAGAVPVGHLRGRAAAAVALERYVQQGPRLTATGEQGPGAFGSGVALSADGSTALVGAPDDGNRKGAAWIFVRTGSSWHQQAKLAPTDEAGPGEFGASVALSADGRTAIVGAPGDDGFRGAAWVFVRSRPVAKLLRVPASLPPLPIPVFWQQQGPKLRAAGEEGRGSFGFSVALSADGDAALVGAPDDRYGPGSVRFLTRAGGTWSERMPLLGDKTDASGQSRFGAAVSLSADGTTALIGGPGDAGSRGAAWIFTRSGFAFHQQGPKLTGSGEIGAGEFGVAVALAGDGSAALVGAPNDDTRKGAAWVIVHAASGWLQQGTKLTGGGETGGGELGVGVALSGNGKTALVGGSNDAGKGAAWVFARAGSAWSQQGAKLTGAGEIGAGQFGGNVALAADAGTALAGGPADGGLQGAAWVFTRGAAAARTAG